MMYRRRTGHARWVPIALLIALLGALGALAAPATAAEGPGLEALVELCTRMNDDVDSCDVTDESMWRGSRSVPFGSDLRWRVTAQNIGDVPLSDVVTATGGEPSCAGLFVAATIEPGQQASVTCDTANATEQIINLVSFDGTAPDGETVSKTRHGTLYIRAAVYELVGSLAGCSPSAACVGNPDAVWSATPNFVEGADLAWQLTLTNAGSRPLADIGSSSESLGCAFPVVDDLAIGETTTVDCDVAVTYGADVSVSVTSSGTGPEGDLASATVTADARVDFASVLHGIDVCKYSEIEQCDPADDLNFGESATFDWDEPGVWRVFVENTGTVDLVDLAVIGSAEPACDRSVGEVAELAALAPGERYTYLCVTPGMRSSMVSSGSASGFAPDGSTATDLDVARTYLRGAALGLEATSQVCAVTGEIACETAEEFDDAIEVLAGSSVAVRTTLTNTSNRPLLGFDIVTPFGTGCVGDVPQEIAAGASAVATCVATGVSPTATDVVEIIAAEPNGASVNATSTASVQVQAIGFEFGVCAGTCDEDDASDWLDDIEVDADRLTKYRISVTNTFAEQISGVVEVDGLANCLEGSVMLVDLAPEETSTVVCSAVATDASSLTASLSISGEALGTVEQSASASIRLAPVDLVVAVFPPSAAVVPGTPAFALVSVTNVSSATAKDVELSLQLPAGVQFVTRGFTPDPANPGSVSTTIGELQAGQASTQTILVITDSNFTPDSPLVLGASVTSLQDDLDLGDNAVEVVIPIDGPVASFAVYVEGVVNPHEVGDIVVQTVQIENLGPSDLGASVSIVLPSSVVLSEFPEGCTQLGTLRCDTTVIAAGDIYEIPLVLEVVEAGTVGLSGAVQN